MLPAVLRFIFARGHAKMWSKMVVRHRDKQTSEQPLKKAIMRRLNELLLYGTYCMVLTVRYFRYGTVRYCISLSHYLDPPPFPRPPPRPRSCTGVAVGEGQGGRTLSAYSAEVHGQIRCG